MSAVIPLDELLILSSLDDHDHTWLAKSIHNKELLRCFRLFFFPKVVVGKGFLSRDQFSRDQLPRDQLSRDQLATRSTLTRSTCHEINSNFFVFCFMGQEYHGANTKVF